GNEFPSVQSQSVGGVATALFLGVPGLDSTNLGRPLSSGIPVENLNIVQPGGLYGDRLNAIDFRVGKILRFGNTRAMVNLDVLNMLNASTTDRYQLTYGANYQ